MIKDAVYNNFFNEFKGETPEDVIRAVYENTRLENNFSYEDWWKYQQDLWKGRYNADIPSHDKRGACAVLLDTLLKVGALEKGPKPAAKKATGFEPG